ncbi:hypothetical protein HAZT_HAZT007954 [Hyalella azteca]|uniref:Phospholipase A2 domain-containing protein n=1 Tax=Hyalella azteca TaxID=294128 RepID=A0A6A0GPG4_HYAAZ|nr:hypothetical protein HAZT_HAZT007954 [Hyalella azteca]
MILNFFLSYLITSFCLVGMSSSDSFFPGNNANEEDSFFGFLHSGMKTISHAISQKFHEMAVLAPSLISYATFAAKFLDSNIEEECRYECKRGYKPVPDHTHQPSFNGCGSLGFSISGENLPFEKMETCCNEHDLCYDTCNNDKEICDLHFKKCLYDICKRETVKNDILQEKTCKASSKLLYTSTISLGCMSYKEAQKKACNCVPVHKSQGGHYGFREL